MNYRLLGLAPEAQAQIFDVYQAVLEASIQRARKEGKYDEGIVDVKGTAITLAHPPQVLLLSLAPPPPLPPPPCLSRASRLSLCLSYFIWFSEPVEVHWFLYLLLLC